MIVFKSYFSLNAQISQVRDIFVVKATAGSILRILQLKAPILVMNINYLRYCNNLTQLISDKYCLIQ